MFESAAIKLTLWYLAIIMAISLMFSGMLYHVSGDELGRNVNRQVGYFERFLGPDQSNDYGVLRQSQLDQDMHHLRVNLFVFNLLVLIAGGAASYWLARRTLDPIESAMESQSRFASDASHELRTPLTAIQTENEVALRDKSITKTQAVRVIKSNLEEVAKLKALSEGLLRLANGNGAIEHPQPVSLKDVTGLAVSRYEKVAEAKKIIIKSKMIGLKALGDKESLVELMAILIDNAIKYSTSGATITINDSRRGRQVSFTVSDKGMGISPKDLPHIFDRFYQAESSRNKQTAAGYGLGLAIAKRIADAHKGHINVTSTLGKGTAFTVYLPAA
jgi:signal transduction histidine kinase